MGSVRVGVTPKQEGCAVRQIGGADVGGTSWASSPPPGGAKGSAWERNIIELAEGVDQRFVRILADHVTSGVIRGERAHAALEAAGHDVAALA